MVAYRPEIEQAMKKYYATLGEKDRRRYAGVEAMKLGAEGVKYIAQLLGCNEKTVRRGIAELVEQSEEPPNERGQRQAGGGRKGIEFVEPRFEVAVGAAVVQTATNASADKSLSFIGLPPKSTRAHCGPRGKIRNRRQCRSAQDFAPPLTKGERRGLIRFRAFSSQLGLWSFYEPLLFIRPLQRQIRNRSRPAEG